MKAHLNGTVIAEADEADLISIEGNWYFPPSSIQPGFLAESPTAYTCPWKGECQYFVVSVDGTDYPDRAFSYPNLRPGAVERVGKDFAGYVAFWKEIQVTP
jgi:uncharacterized protein (DUF427 family)